MIAETYRIRDLVVTKYNSEINKNDSRCVIFRKGTNLVTVHNNISKRVYSIESDVVECLDIICEITGGDTREDRNNMCESIVETNNNQTLVKTLNGEHISFIKHSDCLTFFKKGNIIGLFAGGSHLVKHGNKFIFQYDRGSSNRCKAIIDESGYIQEMSVNARCSVAGLVIWIKTIDSYRFLNENICDAFGSLFLPIETSAHKFILKNIYNLSYVITLQEWLNEFLSNKERMEELESLEVRGFMKIREVFND